MVNEMETFLNGHPATQVPLFWGPAMPQHLIITGRETTGRKMMPTFNHHSPDVI